MSTAPAISILLLSILYITNTESYGFGKHLHRRVTPALSRNSLPYRSHPRLKINHNIKNGRKTFAPTAVFSSYPPWQSSYLREEEITGDQLNIDDIDLSYLAIDLFELPPKTEDLLRKLTYVYVMGQVRTDLLSQITMKEILKVIDTEYRYNAVSFSVGRVSLPVEEKQAVYGSGLNSQEYAAKALSFAAMHCLPAEVTVLLFDASLSAGVLGVNNVKTNKTLERVRTAFQNDGWKSISFPFGLSLRIKRDFFLSKRAKYNPIPRKSFLTRKLDIAKASRSINAASSTKPPDRVVNTSSMLGTIDEDMMAVIEEISPELGVKSRMSLSQDWALKGMQTFFPRQKRLWRRMFSSFLKKASKHTYANRILKKPLCSLAVILVGAWFLIQTLITVKKRVFFSTP